MNLYLDESLADSYHSASQSARVLTENWLARNMFCPRCGHPSIQHFENNRPVADFFCPICKNEYELKSKNGALTHKISDGAYATMIQRITSNNNPDFFFLSYSSANCCVKELLFVPKFFFTPEVIEKRPPLSPQARRAGWEGCNILIDQIPSQGKIPIISAQGIADCESIVEKVQQSERLRTDNLASRRWLMDVLHCVNAIAHDEFSLCEVYAFEGELQARHPENHHVQAKIRQQLQLLRDKGLLAFLGNGVYKKLI